MKENLNHARDTPQEERVGNWGIYSTFLRHVVKEIEEKNWFAPDQRLTHIERATIRFWMTLYYTPTLTGGGGKMNYLNLFRKQCINGGWSHRLLGSWGTYTGLAVSASDSKTCDSIRVRELDGSLNIVLGQIPKSHSDLSNYQYEWVMVDCRGSLKKYCRRYSALAVNTTLGEEIYT